MSLETKLYTLLSGNAGVVALVATRIYPLTAPQEAAMPYVVYTRVSSGRLYSLTGYSNLEYPRMQVDCYGTTYSEAKLLSEAVVTAIRAATTFGTEQDDPQEMFEEDETYRVSIDFSIWNQEG
jgi:hypothetical protein